MAVDVGRLRQSLDPARSAAQVLFGWKDYAGVLTRSASVWRDLTARMTEESVVTPTVFTRQTYPSQKAVR